MRLAREVQVERAAVRTDRHPRNSRHGSHVVFAHGVVYDMNKDTLCKKQIEASCRLIFPLNRGNLGNRLPLERFELGRVEACPDNSLPASVFVYVLLEFGVGEHARAELRASKLRQHLA